MYYFEFHLLTLATLVSADLIKLESGVKPLNKA